MHCAAAAVYSLLSVLLYTIHIVEQRLPDLIGRFLLVAGPPVAKLADQKPDEQQHKDNQEQRAHHRANDHPCSVRSWKKKCG